MNHLFGISYAKAMLWVLIHGSCRNTLHYLKYFDFLTRVILTLGARNDNFMDVFAYIVEISCVLVVLILTWNILFFVSNSGIESIASEVCGWRIGETRSGLFPLVC